MGFSDDQTRVESDVYKWTFPHNPHQISQIHELRIIVIMLTLYIKKKDITKVKEKTDLLVFLIIH